jgi:hypothetical protein
LIILTSPLIIQQAGEWDRRRYSFPNVAALEHMIGRAERFLFNDLPPGENREINMGVIRLKWGV